VINHRTPQFGVRQFIAAFLSKCWNRRFRLPELSQHDNLVALQRLFDAIRKSNSVGMVEITGPTKNHTDGPTWMQSRAASEG
jgi:hypothetical protein